MVFKTEKEHFINIGGQESDMKEAETYTQKGISYYILGQICDSVWSPGLRPSEMKY